MKIKGHCCQPLDVTKQVPLTFECKNLNIHFQVLGGHRPHWPPTTPSPPPRIRPCYVPDLFLMPHTWNKIGIDSFGCMVKWMDTWMNTPEPEHNKHYWTWTPEHSWAWTLWTLLNLNTVNTPEPKHNECSWIWTQWTEHNEHSWTWTQWTLLNVWTQRTLLNLNTTES